MEIFKYKDLIKELVVRDIKDGIKAYGVPACERAKI